MTARPSPANDLSRFMRTYVGSLAAAAGVVVGVSTAATREGSDIDHPVVLAALAGGAVLAWMATSVAWVSWLRSADRDLKARLAEGSREITTRAVHAVALPGRAVHHRTDKRSSSWVASSPDPLAAPALTLAVTVLTDPPRRVVAQVPPRPDGYPRDTSLRVLVHPAHDDVAVLDDRAGAEELAALGADPRWASEPLPTDATVLGGYPRLAAVAAGAFVVGLAVVLVVLALL